MAELLAPAGDRESFFAAVNHGADAIYLGLKNFSARSSAANFTAEELKELVRYARILGTKIYVALNTLIKESELPEFFASAREAYLAGADAVILQDVFLGKILRKEIPGLTLHLSTQSGVCNEYGARLAVEQGFSRVILARETSLADIKRISQIVETECFIQGALCVSYSGQCYFSSFAGGNSGNRGLCKQPCRKPYSLDGAAFSYPLSPPDLHVGKRIAELREAGVTSFKIEGRMRGAAYVAAALDYYSDPTPQAFAALERIYSRGYTEGPGFGKTATGASSPGHIGAAVGRVCAVSGNRISVKSSHIPNVGDGFKFLRDGAETGGGQVVSVEKVPGDFVVLGSGAGVGDEVRITTDSALNLKLLSVRRTVPIDISVFAAGDKRLYATLTARGKSVFAESEDVLPAADKLPLTEGELLALFRKTDGLPFSIASFRAEIGSPAFGIKSVLNRFRAKCYTALTDALTDMPLRQAEEIKVSGRARSDSGTKECLKAVIAEQISFFKDKNIDIAVFAPTDYREESAFERFFAETARVKERYLYIPAFATSADLEIIRRRLGGFDGVFAEGSYGAQFSKELGVKLFAGAGFNVFNSLTAEEVKGIAERFTFSKELSERSIGNLGATDGFRLLGGSVKLMDITFCPYGAKCASCKAKDSGVLKDKEGREFPLRRIILSDCRFELYNCLPLVTEYQGGNILYDFRTLSPEQAEAFLTLNSYELKARFPDRTGGHSQKDAL